MGVKMNNGIKVKIGIVGTGYMALEHIRAFSAVEGANISGIYGRSLEKALDLKEKFGIGSVCKSIDDLYQTGAQLVVICVSELASVEIIEECAIHDWKILCEKPIAPNLEAALCLKSKIESRLGDVYVAHNRRFYSSIIGAIEALDRSTDQRIIRISDQEDTIAAKATGVPDLILKNWMYANSIHLIDLFHVFGRGAVQNIEAIYDIVIGDTRFFEVRLDFDSGDIGIYQACWNAPSPWSVQVSTPDIHLNMSPIETAQFQLAGSRAWNDISVHSSDVNFKPGLVSQAIEAVKAASGRPSKLVTLTQSLETMKLISRIYSSSADRGIMD